MAASLVYLTCCQSEKADPEPDCSVSGLALAVETKSAANCAASDGSVTLQASGGEAPYTYSLEGANQESPTFEGLSAGNHTFSITDQNGCSEDLNVVVESSEGGIAISNIESTESGCGDNASTLTITATGGTEPYQYKLDANAEQAENVFNNVSAGEHTIVVSDASGCEFTESVQVTSGISLSQDILPIINNSCTFSNCHGGGVSPNLESKSTVISRAGQIKILTGNGTMPQQGSLTQTQIDMIACWVDDGALDN